MVEEEEDFVLKERRGNVIDSSHVQNRMEREWISQATVSMVTYPPRSRYEHEMVLMHAFILCSHTDHGKVWVSLRPEVAFMVECACM